MVERAPDDGRVAILEGIDDAVVPLGLVESLDDTKADEGFDVDGGEGSFEHSRRREELLAGRSVGEF